MAARRNQPQSLTSFLFEIPLNILSKTLPFTPKIVPFLVCSFLIPLIIVLSTAAGWVVWSNLSVGWEVPLHLQYGDGVPPYANVILPKLIPHQRYNIYIDLHIPFIEPNLQLGNFMTTIALVTQANKTLAHVRRPTMAVPPQTWLLFSNPTSTHVRVPMLDSFTTGTSIVLASIEIGRRDGWKSLGLGQGREVSILSATLGGLAVPHGVRGLAIRFPLLSSIAAAAIFILILSTILGLCILPQFLHGPPQEPLKRESLAQTMTPPGRRSSPDDRRSRRRKRSQSVGSATEGTDAKIEPFPQIIPSASTSPIPLRRRPSRPALDVPDS